MYRWTINAINSYFKMKGKRRVLVNERGVKNGMTDQGTKLLTFKKIDLLKERRVEDMKSKKN